MTHSTKTISARKQTAKFGRFLISSALTAATLVAYSAQAHAEGPWTEWDNQNNFTHTSDGINTTITTTASRSGGDSPDLDIDAHESVRVNQISSDALFYGRAADDADPTRILGSLSSNGRLLIIDRNGVFFGAGSQVDTAGLIATTGDISDDQIMNNEFGNYTIENLNGSGSIELNGQITIAEAGLAGFVAPTVKNNGVINAKLGKVVFASGEKVTLDLYGDKLVEIEVAGDGADALLENTGTISAEGGHIQLTAASAKQAVDNIINVEGVVTASSATRQGGKIVLGGGNAGTVKVAGKVDASGEGADSIDVTGENVTITNTAELKADGGENGDGGDIVVVAEDKAIFRGKASAKGGNSNGKGGFVETSGLKFIDITNGTVDTRAADGTAGTWLIDPTDITIVALNGSGAITVSGDTSTIGWTQIYAALASNNVVISTTSAGNGAGNITFVDATDILGDASMENRTLDFNADNNILVNANTVLRNVGTTTLNADGNVIFDASFITLDLSANAAVSGNLNVIAGDDIFVNAGNVVGTTLGGGNVILTASNGNGGNSAIEIDGTVRADTGKITLNADNYFAEVNATGVIQSNGDLEVNSNHGFDVDQGGVISIQTGDAHINAPIVQLGADINTTGTVTGTATTVKVENSDAEIQDGIDVAASGATVNVGAGTYNEKLLVNKSLTLAGAGRSATTIDTSGLSGYGLQVTADDVNLRAFTLNDDATSTYGIKATGDNLELRNVRVRGFGRSEIDLNGVTGASLINVVADGMNTAGVGIALTNVTNATLTGVTTRNNNWGGVGLYDYSTGATSNIVFDAASAAQLQEDNPVYIDNAFGFGAHDIVLPGFEHAVRNAAFRPDGANFTFFQRTEQDAINYAVNLDGGGTTIGSSVETLGADGSNFVTYENNFVVGEDAFGTSMFINPAVQESDAGGTINVRAGTYEDPAQVVFDKSLTITGAGVGNTIVNADFDTGTGGDARGWWLINAGADVDVSDLTMDGNGHNVWQALRVKGQGSVDNVAFNDIKYQTSGSPYAGTAIAAFGDGTLDITNTTFTDIGRVGALYFGNGVDGSIFTDNTYTGKGAGDWLDYALDISAGADISVLRNTITNNLGVAASDGSISAGILVSTFFGGGTSATIENNVITGNTTGVYVGFDSGDTSVVSATNNDLSGNTFGAALSSLSATADFSGNWWGLTNETDVANYMGGASAAGVDFTPFLLNGTDTDGAANGFQGDYSNLFVSALGGQTGATGRIQEGVNRVTTAGTVKVGVGTFNENVTINKALDLNGSGRTLSIIKGMGTGNGINLTASDINMRDFAVDGFSNGIYTDSAINNIFMRNVNVSNNANYGIEIHNNAVVDGLDMRNVRLTGNGGYGLRARGSVNNLDMHGGLVSGSTNGIGAVKANGDGTYLTNVSIRDVTFTNNALKAIYMEKLSDAEFKNLDIRTSGTTGGSSAGIDINLKYGNYQDIVLDGTKIRDSATGATNNAITIKARNDGSYAANPASLTGLTITNSDIVTTGGYGVVVGNNVNNATLSNNTVDGAIAAGMLVYGGASDIEFDNNTVTNSKIGIVASGSSNVSVHDNDIATAEKGVYADNALNIKIFDNDVTGTTLNGIHVINSDGTGYNGSGNDVDIWGNTVTSSSGTGILVENSAYATIGDHPTNPFVTGFGGANNVSGGENGIVVKGSDNAYISYNIVHDVDQAGIKIENNSIGAKVLNNDIDSTGREGIISLSSDNVEIRGNDVNTVLSYVGIGSVFGNDVTIANNTVSNAKNSAIYTQNMGGTNLIDGNTVDNSSVGIYVSSTSDATVSNNKIGTLGGADNIRGNGITIRSSAGALVDKNVVTETKGAGIALHGTATGVTVSNNDIDNVNREGIFADTDDVIIDTNDINGTGLHGISLSSAHNAEVKNNTINATGLHGIMVSISNDTTISHNKVGTLGSADNIRANGITLWSSSDALVDKNVVTETKGAGIALHGASTGVTVSNNDIDNVNREGIFADTDGAIIDTNDINGTGMQGISLSSADNAQVKNNTVKVTGSHGIMTLSSNDATIQSNTVDAVSGDGVHIEGGTNSIVEYNKVGTTGGTNNIKGDGIYASDSNGIIIRGNEIAETHSTTNGKGNGIKVLNSDNAIIGGLLAWSNVITNAGWDGMSVVGGDSVMIESNIITDAQRAGIFTKDLTNSTLHYNYVNGTSQFRGIVVNNGTGVDLLANTVLNANLDGIFVKNGDKVTVDGNTTNFSGANGILVEGTDNVTLVGNKSFMSGNDGIQVNGFVTAAILNNTISFTTDDGIEVLDGVHVDIVGNIMGHIGHNAEDADGIRVSDVDHSVIKYNAIADVLDDGIRVIGGNYAGIFANHILLTGDDGIEVSGVYASGIPNEWQMLGDLDYPQGGYNVNIQDNEIVLTGDDGIEVGNSESVRINNNDILFAGVGEENVQIVVNAVADELDAILSGPPAPAAFALTAVAPEPADFSFTWGDGDGIEVYDIHRQGKIKPDVNVVSAQAPGITTQVSNDRYSDWTVLIQGNDISWTGGDGIDVNNAGSTLIGGSAVDNIATPENEATQGNTVYQAGISTMSVEGFTSFRDWVETGPFADHEARRDVWWDEDLTDALKGHLTTGLTSIGHDAHDGIIATNITNNGFGGQIGNAGNAGDKPSIGDGEKPSVYVPNYIGYALNIIGNTVSTTGDDGIEAGFSSSALISGNNIMGSGIGGYDGSGLMVDPNVRTSYGSSDEYGADGISVFDIYGENSLAAGSYTNGYEEYALVIDGNIINGTDDDGIEVDGAGRTLIIRNNISEAGVGGGVVYGFNDDFFGSDGIHARGVFNNSLYNSPGTDGQNYYNYALNITGNTVDTTKDDGIDVLLSGSTVIGGNNISHAGYGKERDYNGGGILGADGINVTAVHADTFGRGPVIKNTLDDVPPGFVVDGDYREYSMVIEGNTIDTTGDDGIQVLLSGDTRIAHNTISNAGSESGAGIFGGDGINVLAFGVFGRNGEGYTNVELVDNTIGNSLDNGVDIMGVNVELTADINTITNSGDNGIRLLNMEDGFGDIIFIGSPANNTSTGFNSTVTGNEVSGSTNSGLSVEGTGHNNVILAGNTFTNNAIGARFESGAVDISNLESPNTITNTNPLGLPVGLVFDGDPEDLTINGGTIGATSFNGFLNAGSFYVRFEDGSILDPVTGAPLLINGLNASYDGFTPPADGILTQARLDSLEARIYDADDAAINGRGQLFVGFVPESGSIENIEDFFNRYGAFAGANGNIQVTIARLPYIQQPTGGSQIFSAAGLNGIAPAAGGDDTTPEGLAGIEPAAGEEQGAEEVSCWGDAASNASGGQASSFSFGGSFGGDSITQAAGCNTASAL